MNVNQLSLLNVVVLDFKHSGKRAHDVRQSICTVRAFNDYNP